MAGDEGEEEEGVEGPSSLLSLSLSSSSSYMEVDTDGGEGKGKGGKGEKTKKKKVRGSLVWLVYVAGCVHVSIDGQGRTGGTWH